ncbi:MAG: CgeB family protein [Thermoanaerobaculia bacterium]
MNPQQLPPLGPSLRVFHLGGHWRGANDTVRHMMLGLRQAGALVHEFSTDEHREALDTEGRRYDRGTTGPVWLRREIVGPALDTFDPHLVVCNAGGLAFRPEVASELRRSRSLVGVALSDPAVFETTTRHIAPLFDLFLTNHPPTVARYEGLGVTAGPLRFGTNPEFFRPAVARPELDCEVLVMGHAHADRVAPVRRLAGAFRLHLYGESWEEHGLQSRGLTFGEDSLAALASARCVVVFHRGLHGDPLIKPSLFDFTAAGALVVTNRDPAVEPYFVFDEELVGFEDEDGLVAAVGRLLDHPEQAERIRRAGRARTLRDHTWASAWRDMLSARPATR